MENFKLNTDEPDLRNNKLELIRLSPMVEDALVRRSFFLTFPALLEDFYEKETGNRTNAHFFKSGFLALFVYNLFIVTDYFMIPDIFKTAVIMRTCIVTPVIIFTMILVKRNPRPFVREFIESVVAFIVGLSLIFILILSNSENAGAYHPGVTLILIFSNLFVRIKFRYSFFGTISLFLIYLLCTPFFYLIKTPIMVNNLIFLFSTGLFTLISSYTTEKYLRKNYLLILRERIQTINLHEINSELVMLSQIDALTGLPNRRQIDEYIDKLKRSGIEENIAVILMDLDNFKAYNDYYGHQAGDECLRMISESLKSVTRSKGDLVARYGGEEFLLILLSTDNKAALNVSGRITKAVYDLGIPHEKSDEYGVVTISGGLAVSIRNDNIEELIKKADEALYKAKKAGKNRIAMSG